MNEILDKLNPAQKEAVTCTEGPLLIVAGAGSGKTTVLVNRIAYIIDRGLAAPYQILALTFTNKAAREMKERITALLPGFSGDMWIGTFHSICVKILRRHIDLLGYSNDFVIYDTIDSRAVMKECIRELDLDDKQFTPRGVLSVISGAKNNSMDADTFETIYKNDFRMSVIAQLYKLYQQKLKKSSAVDFDDLLINTVKLLSLNPDLLERYQNRFRYILVDEYQDTNNIQYLLISLLAGGHHNICVVGDDDQSIYKFRGANVGNILSFESDYEDAKRVTLDQNYRSTQTILDAANAVISHNGSRMEKKLWTSNGGGSKLHAFTARDEYEEARFIARTIKKQHDEGSARFGDFAVLYRTNAQSRVLEEIFMREAVPYRVLAGLRFYDRKEIKDIVAYLRLLSNTSDDTSLRRIINEPKRKIGAATVDKLTAASIADDCSVYDIIKNADAYADELKSSVGRLKEFYALIESLRKLVDTIPLTQLITRVINDTGYLAMLEAEDTQESLTRQENINEFINVAAEFEKNPEYNGRLSEFLEGVSLISDIDSYDEDEDAVVMMTIHSAKGLEFPTVFLTGLEEGLFPGMKSITSEDDIEEERRLCYVAITRAKKDLYLTKARSRTVFGKTVPARASRFFEEIPKEYTEDLSAPASLAKSFVRSAGKSMSDYFSGGDAQSDPLDFNKGDIVEHRKFGRGTVVSVKQFGKDAILEINFESIGYKQLMAAFAKLKKL